MISIYLDTQPVKNNHAIRGIGMYTKLLMEELENLKEELTLFTQSSDKKKADLVHYPYFDFFFPTLPLHSRKKTIVTIHDAIPLEFPEFYPPGVKGTLNFYRQKMSLGLVDAIITDSHFSKQKINEFLGIALDKIHVVYLAGNPLLRPQHEDIVTKVRREYKIPQEYLLYVGDINYNKNIPQLIKSLKYLPEKMKLVCVGKNFKEQEIPEWKWIETQMEMSEVKDRVIFVTDIAAQDTEKLAALYSGAFAYIQPSLSEGFGLPLLEAMQCKTPVISSNRGSLPEVGGKLPLYVEPTAEAIAQGVEAMMVWSEAERKRVVQAGKEYAEEFSWKKAALETLEVYKTVLGQK